MILDEIFDFTNIEISHFKYYLLIFLEFNMIWIVPWMLKSDFVVNN